MWVRVWVQVQVQIRVWDRVRVWLCMNQYLQLLTYIHLRAQTDVDSGSGFDDFKFYLSAVLQCVHVLQLFNFFVLTSFAYYYLEYISNFVMSEK